MLFFFSFLKSYFYHRIVFFFFFIHYKVERSLVKALARSEVWGCVSLLSYLLIKGVEFFYSNSSSFSYLFIYLFGVVVAEPKSVVWETCSQPRIWSPLSVLLPATNCHQVPFITPIEAIEWKYVISICPIYIYICHWLWSSCCSTIDNFYSLIW